MSINRHRTREWVVQAVYQYLLNQQPLPQLLLQLRDHEAVASIDANWCQELLSGIVGSMDALDEKIARYTARPLSGLSPVEHAILLLGTQELMHAPEIPYRVIINESVELAKTFGGADGHKFVNGVMDKLAIELRNTEIQSQKTDHIKPVDSSVKSGNKTGKKERAS